MGRAYHGSGCVRTLRWPWVQIRQGDLARRRPRRILGGFSEGPRPKRLGRCSSSSSKHHEWKLDGYEGSSGKAGACNNDNFPRQTPSWPLSFPKSQSTEERNREAVLPDRLRHGRHCWLCPHGQRTHSPLDSTPGTPGLHPLHEGHSGEFVTELALMCTLHAFEQGCDLFERCFGFTVSTVGACTTGSTGTPE